MATEVRTERYRGLDPQALIAAYRNVYLSRRFDDKEIQLKRQNKIYFQINSAGHEAIGTAAGMVLKPGYDWFDCYYRDRALILQLGVTPYEMFLQSVGAKDDPASAGRQMPAHWGSKRLNIISKSSCTGTQFLHAVGAAEAGWRMSRIPALAGEGASSFQRDEVAYVSGGEGQTSEGEFWEALSSASNLKLPVVFVIEDNGYAISVPVEVNTPGGSISKLVRSFPNLFVAEVDGTDFLESYDAMRYAAEYCRKRMGPAFVHAHVIRPYSHSLSDDEANYRPKAERDQEIERDPVTRFSKFLLAESVLSEAELERLHSEVDAEINEAADRALAAPIPEPESAYDFVYSPDVDPTGPAFSTPPVHADGRPADDDGRPHQRMPQGRDEGEPEDGRLRRGRRRRITRRRARRVQGQGRRLQGDRRPPAALRLGPRLQLAARRGQHPRPRDRDGRARVEARRRDPVLRLHLAGVHADPQRALEHAVALRATPSRARSSCESPRADTSAAAPSTTRSRAPCS